MCVGKEGLIAKHRKLHPFINPAIIPGDQLHRISTLWDGNAAYSYAMITMLIENVRATALLGAQIIFMPHVTMCTPSPRPGAGFVDPAALEKQEK